MNAETNPIAVVAAVIIRRNGGACEVFCAQRPGPKPGMPANETDGKWEFPGGKVERGECGTQALEREIREEFGARVTADSFLLTVEHEYRTFKIRLDAWLCTLVSGDLLPREHRDAGWIPLERLMEKDWAAADISVARETVRRLSPE